MVDQNIDDQNMSKEQTLQVGNAIYQKLKEMRLTEEHGNGYYVAMGYEADGTATLYLCFSAKKYTKTNYYQTSDHPDFLIERIIQYPLDFLRLLDMEYQMTKDKLERDDFCQLNAIDMFYVLLDNSNKEKVTIRQSGE